MISRIFQFVFPLSIKGCRLFTASKYEVKKEYLTCKFSRSSGPGGQHVNKTNSKAELRFNVYECKWLPDDVKIRLQERYGNMINRKGEFFVTSERFREQHLNIKDALKKLQEYVDSVEDPPVVYIRKPKKEPPGLKEKRIKEKKRKGEFLRNRTMSGRDD